MEKIKNTLTEKLKTISNDPDFILGVLSNAKDNEDRQSIIDYIDLGVNVTYENILLLSLKLGNERGTN
jgi:hypothetical protein